MHSRIGLKQGVILLNDWSDRQPDTPVRSRRERLAAYVIGAVVVAGTAVFIVNALASLFS